MPAFLPLLMGGAAVYGAYKSLTGIKLNVQQLTAIMPNLDPAQAAYLLPYMKKAMGEAKINTPPRIAAFLAQVAHESGEFRYWEELASGNAYEGNTDLGNIFPGDGPRYKGRGPIQLTGRSNYAAAGAALKLDLENNPEMVATPDVGFRTAAWFWNSRNLSSYADQQTLSAFKEITRRINGGQNGAPQREAYWNRAMDVLMPAPNVA